MPEDEKAGKFVSFHKLSQWLTYSLMEPLQDAGFKITDLKLMTGTSETTGFSCFLLVFTESCFLVSGLPEYRNGGLLVDFGVLVPKSLNTLTDEFDPSTEVIIEWRALTVAILDELHKVILERLNFTADFFPLVKVPFSTYIFLMSGLLVEKFEY